MVTIKVLKNENKLLKALMMGLTNQFVCNAIVDKETVATLQPGEETIIELSPGSHKVFFKEARFGGVRSNKLTVNINPNNDYVIQVQNGMNGLAASYTLMAATGGDSIKCENCGAINKNRSANVCEYCGSPLK